MERAAPWLRAVNTVLTPAVAGRRKKIDRLMERAVRDAEQRTGSTASGDDAFTDDMRALLTAYADVPDLTSSGWRAAVQDVTDRTENRLRIRKLHALNPELADERVHRPVIVTGIPRTGTTVLQRILAAADAHRAPLLHQLVRTDLPGSPDEHDHRRRTDRMAEALRKGAPALPAIHDMGTDRPASCAWILPHSTGHLVRVHPPGYVQWMLDRDTTADYRYLKQALQVLQHGLPPRRWILRSPAHLWNLAALTKVFPDAQIVWTHRDPAVALASLCSMTEAAMKPTTADPDPHGIGRTWLGLLATGVDRARAARSRLPAHAVVDVPYPDLTDRAATGVPALFGRLHATFGPTERAALDAALASRPRGHRYDLDRFGLSAAGVHRSLAEYTRVYGEYF